MKKFFLILFSTTILFSTFAETKVGGTLRMGYPGFVGEDSEDISLNMLRMSASGTIDVNISLMDNVYLIPQFGYGYEMLTYDVNDTYISLKMNKLIFNILGKYEFNIDETKLFLSAGPSISYMLPSTYSSLLTGDSKVETDNDLLFGVRIETGLTIKNLRGEYITFGLGYNQDFTNFDDDSDVYISQFYFFICF